MSKMESNNLVEAYPMVGGDDDHSYAKNSTYQREIVDAAKELIKEAIADKLDLKTLGFDTSNSFKIADLGCSVGPNTFFAVQNIIESVELKLKFLQATDIYQNHPSALEFQVFFNDHYGNDFNTLFKSLPDSRKYFAAGTPGSFHYRLFPKSSIHFVHSSYALHWLSRVPAEIADRNSPAWNKGSISCNDLNKEVAGAYLRQFKNDMESFLNARAEEVVPGGLMVLIFAAVVPDGVVPLSNTYVGVFNNVMGSCLNDLAKMGVVSEEKVDSFNLPIYNATPKELEAIIKRNGKFTIEKMEKLSQPRPVTANGYASGIRAGIDGLIKKHFGDEFGDQVFNHFTIKVEENYSIIEEKISNVVNLFILLKRLACC